MNTIIKVMESLVKMNNWKVERFDLQAYHLGYGFDGYVAYLTISDSEDKEKEIRIRQDGSFDFIQ